LALVDNADEREDQVREDDLAESFLEPKHLLGFSGVHDDTISDTGLSIFVFFENRFEHSNSHL